MINLTAAGTIVFIIILFYLVGIALIIYFLHKLYRIFNPKKEKEWEGRPLTLDEKIYTVNAMIKWVKEDPEHFAKDNPDIATALEHPADCPACNKRMRLIAAASNNTPEGYGLFWQCFSCKLTIEIEEIKKNSK